MFDNFEVLEKYSKFSLTNGMILRELIQQKNMNFQDLFSILGPKSLVDEVLYDKRSLKNSQIKQLAELFGVNPEIFSFDNTAQEEIPLRNQEEQILGENTAEVINAYSLNDNSHDNMESENENKLYEEDNNSDYNSFSNNSLDDYWKD
ncbi:hypothetical protein [Silvanigrella aquatica]|uniref:HTH cro/C1-type domain-containing protein n=1 Tax=Silvanigrella aquatica TaxID=1915309 RepID=A0A1L4CZ15_9BACT|nr:hypothetical protein [Silvanigrella aquatica]APJ03196.1 hypothetical protein AXG55_04475 [Silvanigrella aquatica]